MIEPTPITTFEGETNPFTEEDLIQLAKDRITFQFQDKDVLNRYLQLMMVGKEELQGAIKDLMQKRSLEDCSGAQLDIIGEIVGQPRTLFDSQILQYFGFSGATGASPYRSLSDTERTYGPWRGIDDPVLGTRKLKDDEYRRLIILKILKNTSEANITAFLDAVKIMFNLDSVDYDESLPINYVEAGAVVSVNIGRNYSDPEFSAFPGLDEKVLAERYLNRPLGVGIAYQDPITFIANFLNQTYRIYEYGEDGTQVVTFGDVFTFSRPYGADYYDSSGTLQTAAIDEPRFDYDPNTLDALGLLIESPDEVLTHTWNVEANDTQGTIRYTLVQHKNQSNEQLAMLLEGQGFKFIVFRENTYWKARVELASFAQTMVITQYPSDAITLTITYAPNEVSFLINDETRLVTISTDYMDTNIRGYGMRIGGTYTTSAGQTLNHFNGHIEEIIYLRSYVGSGDAVVDGAYITTEEYDKILTESDDYLITGGY